MSTRHPQTLLFRISAVLVLIIGSFGIESVMHLQSTASQREASSMATADQPAPDANSSEVAKKQPVQTGDMAKQFLDQGQRRSFYLHIPPSYSPDQPMPLVLAFHGSGQQGKQMAEMTGLSKLADQKGFIVAYPDGLNEKWNVSGYAPEDNVKFVHQLIAYIRQQHAIAPERIYAVGLSNGGILVQKLACEDPSQIAAFATVAASLPVQFKAHCQNQAPISLLMINGTADSVVPWTGGSSPDVHIGRNLSIPPVLDVIDFWRQHDVCAAKPTQQERSDHRVQISRYQSCQAGSEVTLVALKGAGHIWSGGGYGTSPFIDSTQTVWNFFQRHSLSPAS